MDTSSNVVHLKNTIRLLPCELTADEIIKTGRRLAETGNRMTAEEAVQEQQKKEMKARTAAIEAERASLSSLIMSGTENRDVPCIIYYDVTRLMVEVVRQDTEAVIETRRMTDAEIKDHQPKLPFKEPTTDSPAEAKSDEDLAEIEKALAADGAEKEVTDKQLDAEDAEDADAAD